MSTTGVNPLIPQGALNKVLVHTIVPSNPQLTVTASFMAKTQATMTFEDQFVDQIGTATGIVPSPMPYVMANIEVNLLRSQAVSGLWIAQAQINGIIGSVAVYSDSPVFPAVTLAQCSIREIVPGPFDGSDPTVKVTVRGVFYSNAVMWA